MNAGDTTELAIAGANDYVLTDTQFHRIRQLVREHTGIALSEAKRQLVYGRLARRLRALKLETFGEYIELLERGVAVELEEFTNAITTNLTSFFREAHHFDYLASDVLPKIVARDGGTRRARIWCCAASTGEEPYSIAMVLREAGDILNGFDVKLLATDLDSAVLATGAAGVYNAERLKSVNAARISRFFRRGAVEDESLGDMIGEICDSHTDYIWDIKFEKG
jgi:chemotaxis protein methyltransferase CheR